MEILTDIPGTRRIGFLFLCLVMTFQAQAGEQAPDEYEVKAAFLFNLTRFIEWPETALQRKTSFAICVLGDNPFGSALERITKGKMVAGMNVQVLQLKNPQEARQCQIVFVRAAEKKNAEMLVEAVRGAPVLTVGETRDFGRLGGAVYLPLQDGSIGVVIHPAAIEASGLKVSAKLLSVAKIFKGSNRGD